VIGEGKQPGGRKQRQRNRDDSKVRQTGRRAVGWFDSFDRPSPGQIAKVGITLYYRYRHRLCLCVTPAICVGSARARENERASETAGWNYLAVIYGASTGPINCKDRCVYSFYKGPVIKASGIPTKEKKQRETSESR